MNDRAPAGFFEGVFDRTLTNLRSAWRDIALSARGVLTRTPRPELSGDDIARLREQMLSCLDGRGGEVTARARAADLGRTYLLLDGNGRERFLRLLASEFDVDRAEIDRCCADLARGRGAGRARRRRARAARRRWSRRGSPCCASSTRCPRASSSSSTAAPNCSIWVGTTRCCAGSRRI